MPEGVQNINENLMLLSLFGGVLLLLYGVKLAGDGLRGWAGPKIKTALETMTQNRVAALFTGIVITFLLQSSSATTVTLVSLIDSGLMTFGQSLGVILGTNIGTTLTVQLISFKVNDFALFICGVGLLIHFMSSDPSRKSAGQGVLGFGIIFLSIRLMSEALEPLKGNQLFNDIMLATGESPLLGILVAALFTAIIQSSAATIGIALTFSLNGMIDLKAAVPIILGANIGTCATALLSSAKSTTDARRSAMANVLFKVVGVLLVLPFLGPFTELMARTAETAPRQIANAHTVFNVGIALILLPFAGLFAKLIEKWVPDKEEKEEGFKPKYLNPVMLATPSLAIAQATRETLRMAECVQDMFRLSLPAIMEGNQRLVERIENMDDNVDMLDRAIRLYLTKLAKEHLTQEDAARQMEILAVVSNLEAIGDVIDKNLMEQTRKKIKKGVQFSPYGQADIEELHARVLENMELAVSAFTSRDRALAEKVHRNKARIRDLEKEYNRKHIERLETGLSESIETSSIHLDVLTNLKRINTHLTNIVYPLIETPAE